MLHRKFTKCYTYGIFRRSCKLTKYNVCVKFRNITPKIYRNIMLTESYETLRIYNITEFYVVTIRNVTPKVYEMLCLRNLLKVL